MRPNFATIAIAPSLIGALAAAAVMLLWPSIVEIQTEIISHETEQSVAEVGASSLIDSSLPTAAEEASGKISGVSNIKTGRTSGIEKAGSTLDFVALADVVMWPLAFISAIFLFAYNSRLARLFGVGTRLIKKIDAAGVKIEINSETIEIVQRQLHSSFQELVQGADDEYERMAEVQQIASLLKNAVTENDLNKISGLRATVHVRDVIFPEYLYQLVDYYPKGGGAHRRNSQRYGIIGRSWRSETSHGTGNATPGDNSIETLIENWGMTQEEAQSQGEARPSSLSVFIKHDKMPVGILYMDSTVANAFGGDEKAKRLAKQLSESSAVIKLGKGLANTLAPLRTAAPSLKIIGPKK